MSLKATVNAIAISFVLVLFLLLSGCAPQQYTQMGDGQPQSDSLSDSSQVSPTTSTRYPEFISNLSHPCHQFNGHVCGTDSVTYDSACLALASGATVSYYADCRADIVTNRRLAMVCTDDVRPTVCSTLGITFASDCTLAATNVTFAYAGVCDRTLSTIPYFDCTNTYEPVCTSAHVTFQNGCLAALFTKDPIVTGACADQQIAPQCINSTTYCDVQHMKQHIACPYYVKKLKFRYALGSCDLYSQ